MRRTRFGFGQRTLAVALALPSIAALVAGCSPPVRRAEPRAPAGVAMSGGSEKVTRGQAADVQFALGRSLEDSDDAAGAEAAYRKAIANDPKRGDARARLAVVLCRKGAFAEASKEFDAAIKLGPKKSADLLCDRGYALYLQRRWAEAESSLNEAIALDATHARSHNNLGLILARQGEGDRAVVEFRKAGCDVADAKANLGLILAMEDRLPEAERAYSESLAAKPGSAVASEGLRVLAQARRGERRPDDAGAVADGPTRRIDGAVARASADLPSSTSR